MEGEKGEAEEGEGGGGKGKERGSEDVKAMKTLKGTQFFDFFFEKSLFNFIYQKKFFF